MSRFAPAGAQVIRIASSTGSGTQRAPLMVSVSPCRPEDLLRTAVPLRTLKPSLAHRYEAAAPNGLAQTVMT